MQRQFRPLFQRRPVRNAVRFLLGMEPLPARVRTRAFSRAGGNPDISLPGRGVPQTPASAPSVTSIPEPVPASPLAPAVQPTGNAMAVASETDLDAGATRSGGRMSLADAGKALSVSTGGLFADLPPATPRPRTTEVPVPAPAPMVRAVNKTPATTTSAVSQPAAATPAANDQQVPSPFVAQVQAERKRAADANAQAQAMLTRHNGIIPPNQQAAYFNLLNEADQASANARNYEMMEFSRSEQRARLLSEEKRVREAKDAPDTLTSNLDQFHQSVKQFGPEAAADAAAELVDMQDKVPDLTARAGIRANYMPLALGSALSEAIRNRQGFVAGDPLTTSMARFVYTQHPSDPKQRAALVQRIVGQGLQQSRISNPELSKRLTERLLIDVETIVKGMR